MALIAENLERVREQIAQAAAKVGRAVDEIEQVARRNGIVARAATVVDLGAYDDPADRRGSRSFSEIFCSVARAARSRADGVSCRSCAALDGNDARFRDRG